MCVTSCGCRAKARLQSDGDQAESGMYGYEVVVIELAMMGCVKVCRGSVEGVGEAGRSWGLDGVTMGFGRESMG